MKSDVNRQTVNRLLLMALVSVAVDGDEETKDSSCTACRAQHYYRSDGSFLVGTLSSFPPAWSQTTYRNPFRSYRDRIDQHSRKLLVRIIASGRWFAVATCLRRVPPVEFPTVGRAKKRASPFSASRLKADICLARPRKNDRR